MRKSGINLLKRVIVFTAVLFLPICMYSYSVQSQNTKQEVITISGKVTDFEGNVIDSAVVQLLYKDFSIAYETYTDKTGYYELNDVSKGDYAAMYVIRPKEYPRINAVSETDMRLEFWAWNVIADRDLIINPRYHKLELYGTTVFEEYGGRPELLVYFRPMGMNRLLSYSKEIYLDKSKAEENEIDISVKPEFMDVEVYADEEQLEVKSIQPIYEFVKEKKQVVSYLVQVDRPKMKPAKPYIIFKVVGVNKEHAEKGENLYFLKLKNYF